MSDLLLCIETATSKCSVCLSNESQVLAHEYSLEPNSHSSMLTVMIESCLDQVPDARAQLKYIALSAGPGSYTGLRVGASVAKGLCLALDCKLIAIDTLKVIAAAQNSNIGPEDLIVACIDARREEIYHAIYNNKLDCIVDSIPLVLQEDSFEKYLKGQNEIHLCGDAALKCQELVNNERKLFHQAHPEAQNMVKLAWNAVNIEDYRDFDSFEPNYLKSPNITTRKKRLL